MRRCAPSSQASRSRASGAGSPSVPSAPPSRCSHTSSAQGRHSCGRHGCSFRCGSAGILTRHRGPGRTWVGERAPPAGDAVRDRLWMCPVDEVLAFRSRDRHCGRIHDPGGGGRGLRRRGGALVRCRPCLRHRRRVRRRRHVPQSRPERGESDHPSRPPPVLAALAGAGGRCRGGSEATCRPIGAVIILTAKPRGSPRQWSPAPRGQRLGVDAAACDRPG